MKTKAVPSRWLGRDGRRLDCGPYMSGALEAHVKLASVKAKKETLASLTKGYRGGIYNGPQFQRNYVDSAEYGVLFLTGGDVLQADLSRLPFLSRRDAESPKLSHLRLSPGMTLISCSGAIGRMAYVRPGMDGIWSSQDVMKVVPDRNKIPPGYLYAYLSSRFGVPLVVGGTYGAIIQHIEPEHIEGLPVPRFGSLMENAAGDLVEEAAILRDGAAAANREALKIVHGLLEWRGASGTNLTQTPSSALRRRMDAFHHSAPVVAARKSLARSGAVPLGSRVSEVFEPNRGRRLKVDDPAFGVPFLSSSEVFRLDPIGEYSISRRRTPNLERLLVTDRDLLLPRSGQLGGVIGRAVLPLPTYYDHAASEHLVRVRCRSREDAFFLWSIFASEPGYLATIGTAFGSSIPSLDCELLARMQIPWFDANTRGRLHGLVSSAVQATTEAIVAERRAVLLVENAIEKGVH